MADTNITFAKIVANPNPTAWSQAYNAGKLFAVISLETIEASEEKDYLNVLGKEILDVLEQEFFTLEKKDLDSIKQAVNTTSGKIPSEVRCSFVIATYVENVLYLYILGGGRILLKRDDKLGILLESQENDAKTLKSASGFLQDKDIVFLETKQFSNTISKDTIAQFLDKRRPSEIAEHIAPLVHEKDEAGAAAIIIEYTSPEPKAEQEPAETIGKEEEEEETIKEESPSSPFYSSSLEKETAGQSKLAGIFASIMSLVKPRQGAALTHPRKVILTIVVIILIVFVGSIAFAVKKQQDAKTQSVFQSIYPQASKKFGEGKSLLGLNEGLAQDSFNEAKTLLEDGKSKLPQNSPEEKKVLDLLSQINQAIGQTPKPNVTSANAVSTTSSNLLNAEIKNQGLYFSGDTNNIYFLTSGAIYSLNTDGTNKNSIITNSSDWTNPGGFSTYNGNMYVLDKKPNQILKFVATDSGFSKSDYFPDNSGVDFSKAVSMTIDSSVYILSSNGSISKYKSGALESFTVSGLDKDLLSPTKIYTSSDATYVYVLDNGNSRIVVLDKNGAYKAQYQTGVIKQAKDFDVDEQNSKAYVLSGGKVYLINLQ